MNEQNVASVRELSDAELADVVGGGLGGDNRQVIWFFGSGFYEGDGPITYAAPSK